jgi:hypothetical protein
MSCNKTCLVVAQVGDGSELEKVEVNWNILLYCSSRMELTVGPMEGSVRTSEVGDEDDMMLNIRW